MRRGGRTYQYCSPEQLVHGPLPFASEDASRALFRACVGQLSVLSALGSRVLVRSGESVELSAPPGEPGEPVAGT